MMVEDCIAMSEAGDWYAFPPEATRAQVITALARESSWMEILQQFHVKRGWVWESEPGWFEQCEETDAGAKPCWIAKARP